VIATPSHGSPKSDPDCDRGTFEDLYRQLWAPMVRLAWLLAGSREVAEDVVHDAFLGLEPRWREVRDPEPYLRRSVVNGVRSQHRRRSVERRHRPAPQVAIFNPEVEEIWGVVADLPERQRHALVLRFYLDLTVEQVAEQLQCPLGTAKSLIHRGVVAVRERIEK
jgi:RNA polymerase sigma factor (sigma-70 family)